MQSYLWIAIGSALGGTTRYWVSGIVANLFGETFPWGTLIVNILGSFIIGLCGGFTTFSSFSLQTLNLVNDGEWLYAGFNIGASVVLCLFAVWLGHAVAVQFNTLKWM